MSNRKETSDYNRARTFRGNRPPPAAAAVFRSNTAGNVRGLEPSQANRLHLASTIRTDPPIGQIREEAFRNLREIFVSSQIDDDVIRLVLTECDFKVDVALDQLLTLLDDSVAQQPDNNGLTLKSVAHKLCPRSNNYFSTEENYPTEQLEIEIAETCHQASSISSNTAYIEFSSQINANGHLNEAHLARENPVRTSFKVLNVDAEPFALPPSITDSKLNVGLSDQNGNTLDSAGRTEFNLTPVRCNKTALSISGNCSLNDTDDECVRTGICSCKTCSDGYRNITSSDYDTAACNNHYIAADHFCSLKSECNIDLPINSCDSQPSCPSVQIDHVLKREDISNQSASNTGLGNDFVSAHCAVSNDYKQNLPECLVPVVVTDADCKSSANSGPHCSYKLTTLTGPQSPLSSDQSERGYGLEFEKIVHESRFEAINSTLLCDCNPTSLFATGKSDFFDENGFSSDYEKDLGEMSSSHRHNKSAAMSRQQSMVREQTLSQDEMCCVPQCEVSGPRASIRTGTMTNLHSSPRFPNNYQHAYRHTNSNIQASPNFRAPYFNPHRIPIRWPGGEDRPSSNQVHAGSSNVRYTANQNRPFLSPTHEHASQIQQATKPTNQFPSNRARPSSYQAQSSTNPARSARDNINPICSVPSQSVTADRELGSVKQMGSSPRTRMFLTEETRKAVSKLKELVAGAVKVCVILRGVPGSGKTTLARYIQEQPVLSGAVRASADEFFIRNDVFVYDVSKLSEAHEWTKLKAFRAMQSGHNPVLIDNTNTQAWEMLPYVEMAEQFGYRLELMEPGTPWMRKASELERLNVHGIPSSKIQKMLKRYETVTRESLLSHLKRSDGAAAAGTQTNVGQIAIRPTSGKSQLPDRGVATSATTIDCFVENSTAVDVKRKRRRKKKTVSDVSIADFSSSAAVAVATSCSLFATPCITAATAELQCKMKEADPTNYPDIRSETDTLYNLSVEDVGPTEQKVDCFITTPYKGPAENNSVWSSTSIASITPICDDDHPSACSLAEDCVATASDAGLITMPSSRNLESSADISDNCNESDETTGTAQNGQDSVKMCAVSESMVDALSINYMVSSDAEDDSDDEDNERNDDDDSESDGNERYLAIGSNAPPVESTLISQVLFKVAQSDYYYNENKNRESKMLACDCDNDDNDASRELWQTDGTPNYCDEDKIQTVDSASIEVLKGFGSVSHDGDFLTIVPTEQESKSEEPDNQLQQQHILVQQEEQPIQHQSYPVHPKHLVANHQYHVAELKEACNQSIQREIQLTNSNNWTGTVDCPAVQNLSESAELAVSSHNETELAKTDQISRPTFVATKWEIPLMCSRDCPKPADSKSVAIRMKLKKSMDTCCGTDVGDWASAMRITSGNAEPDDESRFLSCLTTVPRVIHLELNDGYIPEAGIPDRFPLDKGCSVPEDVEEEWGVEERLEAGVMFLSECFPMVSEVELAEVLCACGYSVDIAAELFLDMGYMYNDPTNYKSTAIVKDDINRPVMSSKTLPTDQPIGKSPKRKPLTLVSGDSVKSKSTAIDWDHLRYFNAQRLNKKLREPANKSASEYAEPLAQSLPNNIDRLICAQIDTGRDMSCDKLTLTFPESIVEELVSRFGPISIDGFNLSDESNREVDVDPRTSLVLHQLWTTTQTLRHTNRQATSQANIGTLLEGQTAAAGIDAQTGEQILANRKAAVNSVSSSLSSSSCNNLSGGPTASVSRTTTGSGGASASSSLYDIMNDELELQAIYRSLDDASGGSVDVCAESLSTKLKRRELQDKYPHVNRTILDDIFTNTGYSMAATTQIVEGCPELLARPQDILSKDAVERFEAELVQRAKATSIQSQDVDRLSSPDRASLDYDEILSLIRLHRGKQRDCIARMQAASSAGCGAPQIALHYAERARQHKEEMSRLQKTAAVFIAQSRQPGSIGSGPLASSVDLHGLSVLEALHVLSETLALKERELCDAGQGGGGKGRGGSRVDVITGRGQHSVGGVARLRPAISDYLRRNGYHFTENTPGIIRVYL